MINLVEKSGYYESFIGFTWRLVKEDYEPKERDVLLIESKSKIQKFVFVVKEVGNTTITIESLLEGETILPLEEREMHVLPKILLPILNFYVGMI